MNFIILKLALKGYAIIKTHVNKKGKLRGVDPVVNFGRSALAELKYKFVSE